MDDDSFMIHSNDNVGDGNSCPNCIVWYIAWVTNTNILLSLHMDVLECVVQPKNTLGGGQNLFMMEIMSSKLFFHPSKQM